jgi:cold shock protein
MKIPSFADAIQWQLEGPHPREQGIVVAFNPAEGHGQIRAANDGDFLFVHFAQIRAEGFRLLEEGQRVEFARQPAPNGWHAFDVVVIPDLDSPRAG